MNVAHAATIAVAYFIAGAINAAAGGGSFISFPAMLATGLSPISANATNNVAMWLGSLSSASAFREDLHVARATFVKLALASTIGSTLGALLLLRTSNARFADLIPVLLFAATALFIAGPALQRRSQTAARTARIDSPLGLGAQTLTAVYGGFFGAAMGIVLLALLGALGIREMRRANALKVVLATIVNGVAVVPFVLAHIIAPHEAVLASIFAMLGGYLGAGAVKRLPSAAVRTIVIVVACTMTGYFTWTTYLRRAG